MPSTHLGSVSAETGDIIGNSHGPERNGQSGLAGQNPAEDPNYPGHK